MISSREWLQIATDGGRIGKPGAAEAAVSRRRRGRGRLAAKRLECDPFGCVGLGGLSRPLRDSRPTAGLSGAWPGTSD